MPHNIASIRVLEKAGFHKEGIALKNVKINGKWEDHQVLAIINPKLNVHAAKSQGTSRALLFFRSYRTLPLTAYFQITWPVPSRLRFLTLQVRTFRPFVSFRSKAW